MHQKDLSLYREWEKLLNAFEKNTGARPKDLHGVLFLIGVQELGQGPHHFSKEQKQDLMHIAICKLLSQRGFYTLDGADAQGWPLWKKNDNLPPLHIQEQEVLLKQLAIEYFQPIFSMDETTI